MLHAKMSHAKTPASPRPPATPWLQAVLLGVGINAIAAGAIVLGTGAAISAALTRTVAGGR